MFTGIVEEMGEIKALTLSGSSGKITVKARKVLEGTVLGDSIAVNGICLTVTDLGSDFFTADIMAETVRRSSLRNAAAGDSVNLERAMAAGGRFGGHIVSGHVDGTGIITNIQSEENAIWYTIKADVHILKYIVEKGSVCLDGISLTVAYVDEKCFKVSVIPHTRQVTVLSKRNIGSSINIENDIIGKYVERLISYKAPESGGITMEMLKEFEL